MKVALSNSSKGSRQQQQQEHRADSAAVPTQEQQQQADIGSSQGPSRTPGYNVAYVGNIAFEATAEDVSTLFAECGVTKVIIAHNRILTCYAAFSDMRCVIKPISNIWKWFMMWPWTMSRRMQGWT